MSLAVLVVVAGTLAVETMHYQADQRRQAQVVLERIDGLAHRLLSIQRRIESAQELPVDQFANALKWNEAMHEALWQLESLGVPQAETASLRAGFDSYEEAAADMYNLLAQGMVVEAGIRSQVLVVPLHERFSQLVAQGAEEHLRLARREYLFSVYGSVLLMLSGAGAAFLLMRRYQRLSHEAALLSAEQRVLRKSEQRIDSLLRNALDVVVLLDAHGKVLFASPALQHVMGYPESDWIGRSCFEIIHPDDLEQATAAFREILASPRRNVGMMLRVLHADGSWRIAEVTANNLMDDPAVQGIVITYRDVTERRAAEARMERLAYYDALTNLPNRILFKERLVGALAGAEGTSNTMAVMFLDLDNFKWINDSLGHEMGDRLLVAAAERIRASISPRNTAARLGGDEFTVLIEDLVETEDAERVARKIQASLREAFVLNGHEVVTTASIGIAYNSVPDLGPDDLLRNADSAMYQAKNSGRARHVVYSAGMTDRAKERLELESDLRRAVERGELRVLYQPGVELATGRITDVEALVRWQHPRRGLLSPAAFIPLAEETGLIHEIGRWVLEEACRQVRLWQTEYPPVPGRPPLTVSVNLSARQIQDESLAEEVARVLRKTRISPSTLRLEITESVMMVDAEATIRTLRQFKSLGVKLAIDDFGKGYSSLAYLKRFPVDILKIDKSFIERIADGPEDRAIVRAIITLATTLNQQVTAEGIETSTQCEHLKELGCERGQGFYFACPLPPEEIHARLRAQAMTG